eukprot:CAMPEP_0194421234 /NCGR_PEP_ID=MMETSP0176-20130528/20444_1 /TAXON_ID=216777 /ORGANISM="Proboscia alata, Strain PI-D3" /LENGTH=305 /DNA_ID=CAMNT_0039229217 /DNA_START=93 /DNA_END=1010 /DNA_ORIENTATION=+
MVFYIVGLGMGDEKDITVRGLEAVKSCDAIFLENYTSILGVDTVKLEEFYGKPITIADRHMVESEAEQIYLPAKEGNVALLVVGDPVCATTHTDMIIRARDVGIKVEMIHNASIMGAIGCTGLQLYNFGQTVSIPFFTEGWKPISFYEKIDYNRRGGMHTLCLLDIKVKEPDFDAMMRGRTVFLPPRYMTVNTASEQLLEALEIAKENENGGDELTLTPAYSEDTLCVGAARLGREDQCIVAGTLKELTTVDFGGPLHSMVICGSDVHDLEWEVMKSFLKEGSSYVFTSAESKSKQPDGRSSIFL